MVEVERCYDGPCSTLYFLLQDAVERFYEISKKEVREAELAALAKEREMELMTENHRVEIKVSVIMTDKYCR